MTYVSLPDGVKPSELVFYLAMEEYLASHLDEIVPSGACRELFFLWQVPPTVIFGRNQVMEAEVNVPYCLENGIRLYRRKSGGGCVYSDEGNIMLSFICGSTDVASTFGKCIGMIADALKAAGLPAATSGRNDVLVDGGKVSGNAFFLLPASSIVHGTMLFDSDFDALSRAITPSAAKISSKGVESVRQRVTNLKPYFEKAAVPWQRRLSDIGDFKRYLISQFCGSGGAVDSVTLTDRQLDEIEKIEQGYIDPAFLSGRNHAYTVRRTGTVSGAGEISVEFDIREGKIAGCQVSGDYFSLKDGISEVLSKALEGASDSRDEVRERLCGVDLSAYVAGLDACGLLSVIYGGEAAT